METVKVKITWNDAGACWQWHALGVFEGHFSTQGAALDAAANYIAEVK
jgi:hypothetical protein